jgi:ankyrin repeat protein
MTYPEQCTNLMIAAMVGAVAHTRQLLDRGADPNFALPNCGSRALHWLAWRPLPNESDRADVARLLVEAGADVNARIFSGLDDQPIIDDGNVYLADHGSATVLHTAAADGAAELVRTLLELGADPNLRTRSQLIARPSPVAAGQRWQYMPVQPGFTPLDLAEQNRQTEVAAILKTAMQAGF